MQHSLHIREVLPELLPGRAEREVRDERLEPRLLLLVDGPLSFSVRLSDCLSVSVCLCVWLRRLVILLLCLSLFVGRLCGRSPQLDAQLRVTER